MESRKQSVFVSLYSLMLTLWRILELEVGGGSGVWLSRKYFTIWPGIQIRDSKIWEVGKCCNCSVVEDFASDVIVVRLKRVISLDIAAWIGLCSICLSKG